MKKNYFIILLALLISLFIYLFYRTENTVVTKLAISLLSRERFEILRNSIVSKVTLNEHIINSLPEGLWVFCITLTSKNLYLKINDIKFDLLFLPLIFSVGLEFFQLLHLTNGRFDFWDIGVSVVFWAIAHYCIRFNDEEQNALRPFNKRSMICTASYFIVYLAHVWK